MASFPPLPPNLRNLQTFMKISSDMEKTDPVITYWIRIYCVQIGLKIDNKSKEVVTFLTALMDWLEKVYLLNSSNAIQTMNLCLGEEVKTRQ